MDGAQEAARDLRIEDLKELLEETLEVAKENNKLLKRMRREAFWGGLIKLALYVILIVGSFYLTLQALPDMLKGLQGAGGQGADWQALINQYTGQLGQ